MVVEVYNLCYDLLLFVSVWCGCVGFFVVENEELYRGSGRDSFGCLLVMWVSCSYNIIFIIVYGFFIFNG